MTENNKKIAIIGAGVSGLTCAHYLVKRHDVTLFEAREYIGGHVNTLDVSIAPTEQSHLIKRKLLKKFGTVSEEENVDIEKSSIDTGFIVFNERTYPNFFRLLDELQVPFQKTDMSFSVKNPQINFEYNGHTLNTLFAQRRNVMSPKFWRFAKDIVSFNKHIKTLHSDYKKLIADIADLEKHTNVIRPFKKHTQAKKQKKLAIKNKQLSQLSQETLGDYLASKSYGSLFTDNYLIPMVSAIWSMGLEDSKAFPLIFFAQFFDNHGLLDIVNRPQWFTIKGGSKQYVNKLVQQFTDLGGKAYVKSAVHSVTRLTEQVVVEFELNGKVQSQIFDEVIFACHADVALKLLADPSKEESEVLGAFSFTDNVATLHTDINALPKRSHAWASWNYLLPKKVTDTTATVKPVLTYHMNILQRLVKDNNYLVTLNHSVAKKEVIKNINYRHPVYNTSVTVAQQKWQQISAQKHTHFCGAFWFNGFHEDGVKSGVRVCQKFIKDLDLLTEVKPEHLLHAEDDPLFSYEKIPYKNRGFHKKQSHKTPKGKRLVQATTNTTLNAVFDKKTDSCDVVDGHK